MISTLILITQKPQLERGFATRIIGWGIRFNAYIFFQLRLNKVNKIYVANKF